MKAAALVAVTLVLCVALPGPIQAKEKPTFCVGKDGKNYAVGDSYVDNEGEACVRYKCAKRKGTFIMKKEKCDCNGDNHGISCCPNYVNGDMVGGSEIKITFSPNTENNCQNSCKIQHPTSIGVTQDHDGTSSCYCEFGSPIIGGSANVYKTCLFSTATSGLLKTIKRRIAATTTTTTAPTTTSTSSTSTMTTLTTTKADSIYFIAGGGGALRDIELYHPTMANLSCSMSPPPLNNDWHHHTTFYYNNTIHLYGGSSTGSTCISYSNNTEEWKTHTLTTSRRFGSSSVVLKNRVFIIGGIDASYNYVGAESTPLPLTDQPVLTPEPNLDYKGTGQCTTKVDEDTLVVTGGYYNGYLSSVIEYNAKTRTATALPSMKQPRNYHGCAVVEMDNNKWIIVAGGRSDVLETTEMLQMGGSYWKPLGNLNVARYGHSIAVTQRGVMAMGGRDTRHYFLSSVELLDWSTTSWTIVQPSLSKSRYHFGGAVEIPASMFRCQVCPPPSFPQNGDWVCDFDNHNCHLQCDAGFTSPISTVRCQNGVWDQGTDNAKCTESFSSDSVYFVAGGRDNQKMYYDTELYSPTIENLQCSITLPEIDRSIRHWLEHCNFYYNNTIYSCGPDNTGLICMSYSSQMRDWKTYKVTPGRRDVSGVILEDTLYLIGGSHEWPEPTSTKLPLSEQSVWSKVPNLNFKGSAQCVSKIDEESLVITGGINYGSRKVADVKQYNAKTSVETSLSPMSQHRFTHGCVVVERDNKKWLIVSGGHNDSMHLQSTEMLQLLRENSSWISLGNLNWRRAYLGMAETVRGVMVMGGNDKTGSLKSVELLDWATKRWKVVQPSLKKGRNRFGGVLKIPASMFNCQVCPSPPSIKNGNWTCDLDNNSCHLQCDDGFTSPVSTVRCQNGVWEQGTDNAECTESLSSESVYFIAGGYGKGKKYYDIELYSPTVENLQCSITLPQLDDSGVVPQWYLHQSLYHNNTIYICEAGHRYVCLTYNSQMTDFKTYKIGNWGRAGFSAIILGNTLYFIGGSHCNCEPNSTPLPLTDRSVWTNVPNLHYKGEYQCVAKIDKDSFVITGGRKGGPTLSYVTQYNAKTSTVTSLPKFKHPRFEHACVVVVRNNKKWLILAGGWNGKSSISSAEMLGLEMEGSSWETLGNLNEKRTGLSMVETERGIMAMGGRDFNHNKPGIDVYHKTVELLDWVRKLWKVVHPSLNKERQLFGGALKIPASMFKCQAAGDGEWSAWSKFTACSATCGNTTKTRNRTCSNPSPSNGGKPCPGLDEEVVNCGLSPCGFNMSATCDDVMWLFADGDLLVKNSSDWRVTSEVHIPACTKVIEIHCLDSWIHGGILASSDNGLITDGAWNCSSDNRTTWNPAYLLGRNGRTAPDISPEAIWIWTDMSHWMQTDHRRHAKAICKIELETSQCPESPVCPPFGELTPTTISTPTPAPTTTSTTSKPKPGFNLTATCDNEMKLFVDGNLLATSSNWRDTSKVNIPANTEALEIHCMDTGTVGGILASSDNGLLTDGAWNCSSDNGTTWNPAYEVGPNSGAVPDISPEAEWIWTGCIGDWTSKYTGKKYQKNIMCKIDLKPVVDGGWSEWSAFSLCSATCGDATKTRTRTCSNPTPNNGGDPCLGLEDEVVSCEVDPCGGDSCPYTDKYMDCSKWKNYCESGQWQQCVKENCQQTCKCTDTTSTTPTNLVVTGGDQPSTEKSSEVISSENVCSQSIPPLLTGFQQLSTSIFFNNSIWVCGGYPWVKKTCQILKAGASQWTYGPGLKVERHRHTIIKAGDELIAMGGWKGISSMEKISLSSGEWTVMSEIMPRGRQDHCSVYFPKTKSVVLTGGWPFTKQTDSFDVVSGQWNQLDPLPKELQKHGCITMGQSILVAGGQASDYKLEKNVYRLNMINGKTWQTFGQLTVAKCYFTMGFVDNTLMIAGGSNDDGPLATIDTMEESGVWTESKLSLSVPRYLFAGTMVPIEAFPCHL